MSTETTRYITADKAQELLGGTTPGPWEVGDAEDDSGWSVVGADAVEVAVVPWSRAEEDQAETEADAELIAAAPALAATVIALHEELSRKDAEVARFQRVCDESLPREVIPCPNCGRNHVENARHDNPLIDGRKRPHHTHRCYHCAHIWDSGRWSFGVEPETPVVETDSR